MVAGISTAAGPLDKVWGKTCCCIWTTGAWPGAATKSDGPGAGGVQGAGAFAKGVLSAGGLGPFAVGADTGAGVGAAAVVVASGVVLVSGGGVVSSTAGGTVSAVVAGDGASVVSCDGASVVSSDGASVVSCGGAAVVGAAVVKFNDKLRGEAVVAFGIGTVVVGVVVVRGGGVVKS